MIMKKLLILAAVAFCFAACGNSNSGNEAAVETKAAEHACNHNHDGGHKCKNAADSTAGHECRNQADSTKHECSHEEGKEHECSKPAEQKCDKCKEAEAKKAEQAK